MILGRPYSLWIAASTAVLNVLVAVHIIILDPTQIGTINAALAAVFILVAGSDISKALNTPVPPKR